MPLSSKRWRQRASLNGVMGLKRIWFLPSFVAQWHNGYLWLYAIFKRLALSICCGACCFCTPSAFDDADSFSQSHQLLKFEKDEMGTWKQVQLLSQAFYLQVNPQESETCTVETTVTCRLINILSRSKTRNRLASSMRDSTVPEYSSFITASDCGTTTQWWGGLKQELDKSK